MRKLTIYCLSFLLVFSLLPQGIAAEAIKETTYEEEKSVILFSEEVNGKIELYDSMEAENILVLIPDDTIVQLLEDESSDYVSIRYLTEEYEIYDGFVFKDHIVPVEDAEVFRQNRVITIAEERMEEEIDSIDEEEEPVVQQTLTGLALKQPVHVYESTDRDANILRSYPYGHQLKYRMYSDEWYEATVIIDGERRIGYIHTSEVGEPNEAKFVRGIALKQATSVYSNPSKEAPVLRTYQQGHILKYRAYEKDWFTATVFLNGRAETGYIHAKDVETALELSETVQRVGIKNPTTMYERASTEGKTLRTYKYGQILKVRQFTENWYEAITFIDGEAHTGYIHIDDTGSFDDILSGYAQKAPTTVYREMARESEPLRTYKIGWALKYRVHDNTWYKATVIIDGKAEQGYIHTSDVDANPSFYNGYAHKDPTTVYAKTVKTSKKLKSYEKGTPLKYRYYNNDWFTATVIINGKKETGYIHKDDVGLTVPILTGYAIKSPTRVYQTRSRSSKTLKSYAKGSQLKYKRYSTNWYEVTVIINGKRHTGYIHKNDIGKATDISFVNPLKTYTYSNMISDIKKLQKAYPDLIEYKVVGKSEYGRDIYAVSLGKGKASTFINGSIHAREWISTSLNMYMIENYAKAYTTNKNIKGYNARKVLNDTTIWFMPMANPDGVTLQQSGLSAFQKKDHASLIKMNDGSRNFKRWKANGKGVDINRNFSVHWSKQDGPKSPSYENYRGSKALSSKEAQTIVKFVNDINPQMTINYHSSGRVLYWGYLQKGSRYTRDLGHARVISRMTGYTILYPGKDPSGGGFLQWFTETKKLPSLTPELSPYVGPTNPSPTAQFPRIWNENQAVGLYAAQESAKLFKE